MTPVELMLELQDRDVRVWVQDGALCLSVDRESLPSELRDAIAAQEAGLVAFLQEHMGESSGGAGKSGPERIPVAPRDRPLPLSFSQERFWFLSQFEENAAYNLIYTLRFRGALDASLVEAALLEIVARHESLRTTVGTHDGEPVQQVLDASAFRIERVDLSSESDPAAAAQRLVEREAGLALELTGGALAKFWLMKLGEDDHVLLFKMHHILGDRWSFGVMFQELSELYHARVQGRPASLPELTVQYGDYAAWQRAWYEKESDRLLGYWRGQLEGSPTMDLPADRPRPPVQTFRGTTHRFEIPQDVIRKIEALGKEESATPYMALLAAFKLLLARMTGQNDIVVGSPVGNRDREEIEPLVGLFVNTLVLRTDLTDAASFRDVLRRVREVSLAGQDHQQMPFEQLVVELRPERDLSRNPLFQVLFNMLSQAPTPDLAGIEVVPFGHESVTALLDLSLWVGYGTTAVGAQFEYNLDLFDPATIVRWEKRFQQLLRAVAEDPDRALAEIPLLTDDERAELDRLNDTAADYSRDRTFYQLFEERAAQTPHAVAVTCLDQSLTYGELNQRANRLAHRLRSEGAAPDKLIGVCLPRGLDMLVALLGIQKAGAAYVPLDPTYPEDRIAFIVEDAGIELLVGDEARGGAKLVRVADADGESVENLAPVSGPDHLAYVIFTSGSTGKPKGVQIEHRALVNFLTTMADRPGMTADDVLCAVTTISFDIAGLELYLPLLVGGRIVLATEAQASDGRELASLLQERKVTLLQATPATWRLLLEAGFEQRTLVALCGGEALPRELAEQLMPAVSELWNMYGPTETTIWSLVQKMESGSGFVPIGRPIANTEVYLLDAAKRRVPVGVPGQLYLGGDGLARGYWNRPELTAEKFLPHPFSDREGARIYDTGDLACYRADGRIEFLGRVDHQVKIRGFRIELGEIEHVLSAQDGVAACAVVAQSHAAGDQLVAHLVLEPDVKPSASTLRDGLRTALPEYMVPAAFVTHDALPLTPNGKVDRKALQTSSAPRMGAGRYAAPRTEMEKVVVGAWQALLGVEKIGRHDNFFELGGHSLLIMQLRRRLQDECGVALTVAEVFQFPTVSSMAEHLDGDAGAPTFPVLEERLQKQEAAVARQDSGAIAVVGMAGRFPGAPDLDRYWENLVSGVESITTFTDEELAASGVPAELYQHPNYVKSKGILDDIETFDAGFFGVPAREAQAMDPQQRLFLETAYQAIESAGYDPLATPGSVGVWAGSAANSYLQANLAASREFADESDSFQLFLTGYGGGFLATRVAYKLNLKGPAIEVQTACSTSLVAVAQACQSLQSFQCDMALAGGVALVVPHRTGYLHQEGLIFSPDGHCRPFDRNAQGTYAGEGVGAVLLKRLEDAVADGDPIRAVIRGTGLNNDGSLKVGFTAPSVEGQAEVIAMALANAGVDASTVGYVEAHGTGTPLGDPIEIAALTRAYRAHTDRSGYCGIGSVKSSFGHADAAAGIASLIKAVLALQNGVRPPTLNFSAPNPEIDFAHSPFYVNTKASPWERGDDPRRAGVSAFGFGGTNAHVVLEEAPAREVAPEVVDRPHVLTLSARSDASLDRSCERMAKYLATADVSLADVAFTTQVSRSGLPLRRCVVVRDAADAASVLRGEAPDRSWVGEASEEDAPVAFLFPGQGAQHVDMGRELYQHEPMFRQHVDQCCELLRADLGLDLREILYPEAAAADAASARLVETRFTQPALFVIEWALAQLWKSWGVRPAVVAGHSIGEFVAACLAGVFTLEQALGLVAARGRLMQALPAGDMMSVGLPEAEVTPKLSGDLSLAAVNGPSSCVVAGPEAAVASLRTALEAEDVACRVLHTSHAFHSAMMDPIVEPFVQLVAQADPQPAVLPFVSTVTGGMVEPEDLVDPAYWGRNLRQPVRFSAAAAELLGDAATTFLEVGPGQTLSALVRQHGGAAAGRAIVASMRHVKDDAGSDRESMLAALGRLWIAGVAPDWPSLYPQGRRRLSLPAYPFDRQRYWIEPSEGAGRPAVRHGKLPVDDWFYAPVWRPAVVEPEGAAPRWLLSTDGGPLGQAVAAALEGVGSVVPCAATDRAGVRSALDTLRAGGGERFVALVVLESRADDRAAFARVLAVAQAASAAGLDGLEICVVTDRLTDAGDVVEAPSRSLARGLCQVVPQENPTLLVRQIDVGGVQDAGTVVAEAASASTEAVVARRGRRRWVQGFEPVSVPAVDGSAFRQNGVYLITGGLGGIGLAFAEHLATNAAAKLVLVGRSGLPGRGQWDAILAGEGDARMRDRISKVRGLERAGAEVLIVSADVADRAQVDEALRQAREKFGNVDGIVHAAGAIGHHLVEELTPATAESILAAKVDGARHLVDAVRDESLDFLLLCSSISCVIGGLGLADYASANAYLDALSHAEAGASTPVISVNWDTWSNVGFAVDMASEHELTDEQREERARVLALGIAAVEGAEAFARLVASPLPQVVVSAQDLAPRIEESRGRAARGEEVEAGDDLERHERPKLATEFVAPESPTEKSLAAIVQQLLGIDQVGVRDSFYDLGFDSLLAHRMIGRIRDQMGMSVSLRVLLESPTVLDVAKYIEAARWAAAAAQMKPK